MLDKLYITPRQWLHFLRWALYALVLLVTAMLQTVVLAGRVSICPDFVPIVITCVCLREGPERGGTFALIASLLWCFSGADQGSVAIAVLTIVPVVGSLLSRAVLTNRFIPCLIIAFATVFIFFDPRQQLANEQSIMFFLKFFFSGAAGSLFFTKLLPCVLISTLAQPPVYWLVKRIAKIGERYEST